MGSDGIDRGALRVVFFGTYDAHRPRFRVLIRGLRAAGVTVHECHVPIWGRMEDRDQIKGITGYMIPVLGWLLALPFLIVRYLTLPSHDFVIVPYLGQVDMIPARLLTRLKGVQLVFDPYISLFQTVVRDRQRASGSSLIGMCCRLVDRWAFRLADHVLVDTASHARLFIDELGFSLRNYDVIPVGAESDHFKNCPLPRGRSSVKVLFYGWMIPLHGVETIVKAAALLRHNGTIRITIIGTGQDHGKVRELSRRLEADAMISWIDTVSYQALPDWLADSDICLGIFGTSEKANAVVPNKVFQALAMGRPLITADTSAVRELFTDGIDCILVPPGDPAALAKAIEQLAGDARLRETLARGAHTLYMRLFTPECIGREAARALGRMK